MRYLMSAAEWDAFVRSQPWWWRAWNRVRVRVGWLWHPIGVSRAPDWYVHLWDRRRTRGMVKKSEGAAEATPSRPKT